MFTRAGKCIHTLNLPLALTCTPQKQFGILSSCFSFPLSFLASFRSFSREPECSSSSNFCISYFLSLTNATLSSPVYMVRHSSIKTMCYDGLQRHLELDINHFQWPRQLFLSLSLSLSFSFVLIFDESL